MVTIGVSYILFWALITAFRLEILMAALVTGIVFILLGLLIEGVPTLKRP